MGYLNPAQLRSLGLKTLGDDVLISDKVAIYGASTISIGNNVRIDDFCVLSAKAGGITIGNYVHIAVYCSLIGQEKITLDDFCGLSARVSVYSSSDDYSGLTLTNPTVPDEFRSVKHGEVRLHKHVIVGAGSVILPGVTLNEGAAVGALSLVSHSVPEFSIVSGVPARRIGERKRELLNAEARFSRSLPKN